MLLPPCFYFMRICPRIVQTSSVHPLSVQIHFIFFLPQPYTLCKYCTKLLPLLQLFYKFFTYFLHLFSFPSFKLPFFRTSSSPARRPSPPLTFPTAAAVPGKPENSSPIGATLPLLLRFKMLKYFWFFISKNIKRG